jgi:hypothetical protein
MGLAAVAEHRLVGLIPVRTIFEASLRIGRTRTKNVREPAATTTQLNVLQ